MPDMHPALPLPEPLRGSDAHSFAYDTISRRLPEMVRRLLEGGDWPQESAARLRALIEEIQHGWLRPLEDDGAPDAAAWERAMNPYLGQSWLQPPWFVVETYFFRRILQATGFFQPGPGFGRDPYAPEKRQALSIIENSVNPFLAGFPAPQPPGVMERDGAGDLAAPQPPGVMEHDSAGDLAAALHHSIWGNQADLSIWPSHAETQPSRPSQEQLAARLLVDEALAAAQHLSGLGEGGGRVDFILDNIGLELAYDLRLADFLLQGTFAREVRFHCKPYPTYISDATRQDVIDSLDALKAAADPGLVGTARRLSRRLEEGSLRLEDDYFWVSPLSGWEMPALLRRELREADLVISKGDANYRRWLGDRHWPYTTPLKEIVSYFPAPLLVLRVLKSNTVAGLRVGQPQEMDRTDPEWLYDGYWGIIQFVN